MFLSEMFRECIIYHPNWSISYNKNPNTKMARTKQTARKCLVRQAATKGPKTKGVRKPHRFKPGAVDS